MPPESEDSLFSKTLTAKNLDNTPLLVVGLPRSGSSFLSEIISQINGWYVFDDLYLHRKALEIGATGPLSEAQLDSLLFFLGWQIRARKRFGTYAIPNVSEDEIDAMNAAIKTSLLGTGATWADLQEEWMSRLAQRSGCIHWGYKMPQAFRYLETLFEYYPDMKVIFLMRAPQNVLASYKYMRPDSQDGDPAQYHPVAHAIYWRQAAQAYCAAKIRFKDRVILLRFEDLVAAPAETAGEIATFLGAEAPKNITAPPRPNSSFKKGGTRRGLNGLELSLLDSIAGKMRDNLGFEAQRQKPSVKDIGDFIKTSLVFSTFRVKKIIAARRSQPKK